MKDIQITLEEKGIAFRGEAVNLNGETYKFGFLLGYEQTTAPFDDAKKWCEEQGGELPSLEQAHIVGEYIEDINALLKEAEKELLPDDRWLRTNKECRRWKGCAWCVGLYYGSVYVGAKSSSHTVRAVSALKIE